MSEPKRWQRYAVGTALVGAPVVPAWVGETFPQALSDDPETVAYASVLMSAFLFLISASIGWQLYRREMDRYSEDQSGEKCENPSE